MREFYVCVLSVFFYVHFPQLLVQLGDPVLRILQISFHVIGLYLYFIWFPIVILSFLNFQLSLN